MNLKFDPLLIVSLLIIWVPLIYVMLQRWHTKKKQRALMQVFEQSSATAQDDLSESIEPNIEQPLDDTYAADLSQQLTQSDSFELGDEQSFSYHSVGGKPETDPDRRSSIRRESEREAFSLNEKLLQQALNQASEPLSADEQLLQQDHLQSTLDNASHVDREQLILDLLGKMKKQELINNEMRIRLRQFEISGTNCSKNMLFSTKISQLNQALSERDEQIKQLSHQLNGNASAHAESAETDSSVLTRQMPRLIEKLQQQQQLIAELQIQSLNYFDHTQVDADSSLASRHNNDPSVSRDLERAIEELRECRTELKAYSESEQILIEENTRLRSVADDINALDKSLAEKREENESLRRSLDEFLSMKDNLVQTQVILENTQLHLDQSTEKIAALETQLSHEQQRIDQLDTALDQAHQNNANMELELTQSKQQFDEKVSELDSLKASTVEASELLALQKRSCALELEVEQAKATALLVEQRLSSNEQARVEVTSRFEAQEDQTRQLEHQLDQLDAQYKSSEAELKLLHRQLEDKDGSILKLTQRQEEKQQAFSKLEQRLLAAETDNADLKDKLSRAVKKQTSDSEKDSKVTKSGKTVNNVVPIKATAPENLNHPNSPPDNLKEIKGIGPKIEQILLDNGYTRFDQIAALKKSDIQFLSEKLGQFKGRIERDDWKGSAKALIKKRKIA